MKITEQVVSFGEGLGEEPVRSAVIGQILRRAGHLTENDVDRILEYQRAKPVCFGEAAVRLRLVEHVDVLEALSEQFQYAYGRRQIELFGKSEVVAAGQPFSHAAEAFRALRAQLLPVLAGTHRNALAVLSPDSRDGKTYVAANLAVTFSQLGGRTLLIDADLRTPRQHRLFGTDAGSGLSTMLAGRSGRHIAQPVSALPGLHVLSAGPVPPNPLELLQRPAFDALVAEMVEASVCSAPGVLADSV